ncbi:hypothetical protein [Spartinivicinus poritis]|uniref:Uncharacterized protein n=1 Tax=Spartinivicinus poritis TaxID=2994640 RepID=A0ABT5UJ08_9GAMM|nr:hypothetical protein [Spartinivicinus sp. A2-2]MDE1465029.1 hypothetical protein [Spartinivicinus sp. A2-2]
MKEDNEILKLKYFIVFKDPIPKARIYGYQEHPIVHTSQNIINIRNKNLCVMIKDSEKHIDNQKQNVRYSTSKYATPGIGTLMINNLNDAHISKKLYINKKNVFLKMSPLTRFQAELKVVTPAMSINNPPTPEPTPSYKGYGYFKSNNNVLYSK